MAIFDAFKWQIFQVLLAGWGWLLLSSYNVYVLNDVMEFIDGKGEDYSKAVISVLIMTLFDLTSRTFQIMSETLRSIVQTKISSSIKGLVYAKLFKISSATNKKYDKGILNNMMNLHPDRICNFIGTIPYFLNSPINLVISSYTLYFFIGNVTFYVLFFVSVILVLEFIIYKFTQKLRKNIYKNEDSRSNILSEIIDNIKVIKMNSWINWFYNRINQIKKKEYWNDLYFRALWVPHWVIYSFSYCGLIIVTYLITIKWYGLSVSIPASIIITRLVGSLKSYCGFISFILSQYSETKLSIDKIQDFLSWDEIEEYLIERVDDTGNSVSIEHSNYFWGFDEDASDSDENKNNVKKDLDGTDQHKKDNEEEKCQGNQLISSKYTESDVDHKQTLEMKIWLKDISLTIRKHEFVAIIGDIGSGKSSLISSILGETLYIDQSLLEEFKNVDFKHGVRDKKLSPVIQKIIQARKLKSENSDVKIKI
jgi:ATP-binding cassette, subfamily C (CFTR/MRP), member 1